MSCLMAGLAVLTMFAPARAQEEAAADKPTASLSVDVLSQYVWRGFGLSRDSAVIEPSMTIGYKGFSANVWGNFDTDWVDTGAEWTETDFTLSYTHEIYCGLSGTIGTIYYSLTDVDDSFEVFGGLSYAFPWFTVGLTGYREVSHYPGWWVQLDVSRSIALPWYGMSLALTGSVGYMDLEDEVTLNRSGEVGHYSNFHSGQLLATLNIPVGKYFTVSPKVGYAFPLTSDAADYIEVSSVDGEEDHIFGGINVTFAF